MGLRWSYSVCMLQGTEKCQFRTEKCQFRTEKCQLSLAGRSHLACIPHVGRTVLGAAAATDGAQCPGQCERAESGHRRDGQPVAAEPAADGADHVAKPL
jgi:hypothetical protein